MNRINAVWTRAWKTLVQSAIGAAAGAMLSAIGTRTMMEQVDWKLVASTACLSAISSVLMNIKAELPEVGATVMRNDDDRSDDAPVYEEEE